MTEKVEKKKKGNSKSPSFVRFKISAQDAGAAAAAAKRALDEAGSRAKGGRRERETECSMLIDKNGVLCRRMNMNQNGTHKSFRQTSALTTLLSTHTHHTYTLAHTHCHTLAHAFGRQITERCVLHISSCGWAASAAGQRFCHKPIKSQGQNSCCMFTHAHARTDMCVYTHVLLPHRVADRQLCLSMLRQLPAAVAVPQSSFN